MKNTEPTSKELLAGQLLADGKTTVEIGKSMGISHRTVEATLDRLRWKTNAENRTHLIAILLRQNKIK